VRARVVVARGLTHNSAGGGGGRTGRDLLAGGGPEAPGGGGWYHGDLRTIPGRGGGCESRSRMAPGTQARWLTQPVAVARNSTRLL
jgi:hypothetical protein